MAKNRIISSWIVIGIMVWGIDLVAEEAKEPGQPWIPTGVETPEMMKNRTSRINRPKEIGTYYQATVPDTLDLSERARLGINHFTEIIHEDYGYEMPLTCDFDPRPPIMTLHGNSLGACQAKAVEAMCFLRLMSGSQQNLEREAKMMEMYVSLLGEDGLQWVPSNPDKAWLNVPEPFVMVHGQGRMLRAMVAWYQYTGDSAWKERIDRLVNGIDKHLVVHKDDYAYVPVYGHYEGEYIRSCYTKKGWRDTVEPTHEKFGEEGSLFNHQGHLPGGMSTWYRLTGNEQAIRLAGEMVRFYTKPKFWADYKGGEYPGVVGAEHAHWTGHFHGHMNTLRAILDHAVATNDMRLMTFVRDGYEWARQANMARIGILWDGQGCGCGRLIGVAVKLSLAGAGDYWEDVDLYIRNHGSELQFLPEDLPYVQARSAQGSPSPSMGKPGITTDRVIERNVGGFTVYRTSNPKNCCWLCCSPHGNMGFFYAWDGMLRYQDGTATINLLLNRASPWLDIDSYLPYEGKVVLKNKTATAAFVRIPLWVDKSAVKCRIGQNAVLPRWFGNYLRFPSLKKEDEVTITFPMAERFETWSSYKFRFRGNTVIESTPPLIAPYYQGRAKKYQATQAPMKKVTRYVSPTVLTW
ncbi:MAG: hypothetical protein HY717_02180 [Planctomycetes bacterium]|nr:hypothetical protein [Planctomycetota bacterium]